MKTHLESGPRLRGKVPQQGVQRGWLLLCFSDAHVTKYIYTDKQITREKSPMEPR